MDVHTHSERGFVQMVAQSIRNRCVRPSYKGTLILNFDHLISVKSKNTDPAVTVEAGQ